MYKEISCLGDEFDLHLRDKGVYFTDILAWIINCS